MKKKSQIITTHDLGEFILKTKTVPTPIYRERDMRRFIVSSRSIWDRKVNKRHNKIKL